MSSKKGGGRTYSNQAPNMRGGPKKNSSSMKKKGFGNKPTASGAPASKSKAGAGRKRHHSRAQNAFSFEEEGEEQMDRYDADAADSREYRLPDNFEDEDLDSDEEGIFDDADEEKYGDVFAKQGKGKQQQKGGKKSHASTEDDSEERDEDEYDEDGDEEEEDLTGFEGAETMQLSDMLDMADQEEEEEEKPTKKTGKAGKVKLTKQQQQMLMMDDEDEDDDANGMEAEYSEDEDAEDDEDEDLDMDEEYDEDEEGGEDAHKNLLSFVQGLQSDKDFASDKKSAATKKGKKGAVERTEAFDEDQFALPRVSASKTALGPGGKPVLGGGLKLGDLLKKLPGAKANSSEDGEAIGDNANIAALKKKFNVLQSAHTQTLVEPLPEIRQEEMTRIASYSATKEDVAKWAPLINRHRDAASLSFPLYEPGRQNQSSAEMQTKFQPSADSNLEKDLEKLLNSYGLKESALAGSEAQELTQRHYTPEELAKREDSLAKMKALLFYQEMKQKRINKIKSKNYRRLKKKLREKGKLTLEEMKQLDPEAYEAEQRKADLKRIEERMSLNHSNSSKWMQKQLQLNKNQRGQNTDVREAMREAQQKSTELRSKMDSFPKQKNSDGEEESSDSQEEEDEDEDEDEDEADMEDGEEEDEDDFGSNKKGDASAGSKRAAALRAKLRELEAELGASTEENEPAPGFDQAPGSKKKQSAAEKAAASSGEKLLNLKFTQKAMEKKREETRAMIREYEAELDKEEKKTNLKRERRRQGLDPLDEEALDKLIEEDEANNDESKQLDAMLHGRKKIDAKSVAAKGTNISFASGVGENNVKLLPNSLQSVAAGMNRGSKVKVDAPIAVAVPKQSQAAAAALKTENKHPGQHHVINGKSSTSVDTHFISKNDSEKLFATEEFSSGSEDEDETKTESVNKLPIDLAKLKHEGRAAAQAAKKKAAAALKAELAVSVAGQNKGGDKAKKSVQFSSAADDAEDEDLDAAADAQDAQDAEDADESNPWSAGNVANPRKALRDSEANARKKKKQKLTKQSSATDSGNGDEDEADEDEAEVAAGIDTEMSLHSRRSQFDLLNSNSLSQAELVRKAFSNAEDDAMDGAGDDEDDDFARMKREMMEEDLPKEDKHDVTGLPGWGSWGGSGAQNFKSPAQIAKEAAEKRAKEAKRAAALSMRRDAHLKHVIINEKVDQKAMKYQVVSLPYPFTSQEQYEKSLATPVGKEWNTTSSFQQNIKPRVITKAGEIIDPIKFNPKVGVAGKKAAQSKRGEKELTKISGGNPTSGQKRKR